MAKIAIYDVDSKIPNLALMKLSAFHKAKGDAVEAYSPLFADQFDQIYASTIFDFSDKSLLDPARMEIGGSAWSLEKNLPPDVEAMTPDYSFYGYPHSLGFTMRGCRFRCKFCDVPKKEGRPKATNTVEELWTQRDSDFVVLLDNDFFGNPEWKERIGELLKHDLRVCFSQGLNIRIITDEQARALASVRFWNYSLSRRQVYFAWDRFQDEKLIDAGIERVKAAGIKAWQMAFYVLVGFDTTPEQDLYRVTKLRDLGCDPYAMPYDKKDPYQKSFCRWVNHRAIFNSVKWEDYQGGVKRGSDALRHDAFLFDTPECGAGRPAKGW
jgi:hypothetical protein